MANEFSMSVTHMKRLLHRYGIRKTDEQLNDSHSERLREWHRKMSVEKKKTRLANIESTVTKKYGVRNMLQHQSVRELALSEESLRKAHETKKRNGSYGRSVAEDKCFTYIMKNIDESAQRQVRHGRFFIDFYLPKYDLFVEYWGDYYHGLTMSKQRLSKTPSGRNILLTMKKDQEKISTIRNLITITDSEFKRDESILLEKIYKLSLR